MMANSGIYVIHNTKTGYVYIGQARDIDRRWAGHKSGLNSNQHFNRNLQSAWNEHGADAFSFDVLEYCSIDQLTEREQYFLDLYTPKGTCYNIAHSAIETSKKPYNPALFETPHSPYSNDDLLVLLNEHKTIRKVADILGMSEANLFRILQKRGFKKIVTHHWRMV